MKIRCKHLVTKAYQGLSRLIKAVHGRSDFLGMTQFVWISLVWMKAAHGHHGDAHGGAHDSPGHDHHKDILVML